MILFALALAIISSQLRQCRNYFTGGSAASFRRDEGEAEAEVIVANSGAAAEPVR